MRLFSSLIILLSTLSFTQQDSSFTLNNFNFNFKGGVLIVNSPDMNSPVQREFINPAFSSSDLDEDGIEELLITDFRSDNDVGEFFLYIYSLVDSFTETAVINAGYMEPYVASDEELSGLFFVTGNPEFRDFAKSPDDLFSPSFCWKYEDGEVFLINDELYDFFMKENNNIIDYLDDYFSSNIKNCNSSIAVKSAIAAGYANYVFAGEISIAQQFIKKYYFCDDSGDFKLFIDNIIMKDQ